MGNKLTAISEFLKLGSWCLCTGFLAQHGADLLFRCLCIVHHLPFRHDSVMILRLDDIKGGICMAGAAALGRLCCVYSVHRVGCDWREEMVMRRSDLLKLFYTPLY